MLLGSFGATEAAPIRPRGASSGVKRRHQHSVGPREVPSAPHSVRFIARRSRDRFRPGKLGSVDNYGVGRSVYVNRPSPSHFAESIRMNPPAPASMPSPSIFGWKRLRVVLLAAFVISVFGALRSLSFPATLVRLVLVGLIALLVFGVLERWPRRLPPWVARWALQVSGVAFTLPFAMAIIYALTTFGSSEAWYQDSARMKGYAFLTTLGLLCAPWIAIAALLRQIKDEARKQALTFELERSEFERKALDARLRLLQAQVEPHFLFNTLANIRELVESGSPQAATVLASLIAYLRAAVPRLQSPTTTLEQEFSLVRAYLDVMQMRMPDRLQVSLSLDPACAAAACPPMMLLTLVENAVRHGIDPSVNGGRILVSAEAQGETCRVAVIDTGVGMQATRDGLGTGLSTLRERLQLVFGERAQLRVSPGYPHGVVAIIEFPHVSSTT